MRRFAGLAGASLQVHRTHSFGWRHLQDCVGAQNRYYGILYDGEVVCRGIEIRRNETLSFIREFQVKLIQKLFDCGSAAEVYTKGYENAAPLVTEAIDKIMTGEFPIEELLVSNVLRKSVNQYRSVFLHVTAAIRLTSVGKSVSEGENIQFLFPDADYVNPLCRVVTYEEAEPKVNIDRQKYRELLLDAAETILSPFGFTRALYGLPVKAEVVDSGNKG